MHRSLLHVQIFCADVTVCICITTNPRRFLLKHGETKFLRNFCFQKGITIFMCLLKNNMLDAWFLQLFCRIKRLIEKIVELCCYM